LYYILEDKKVVEATLDEWSHWFENNSSARVVSYTEFPESQVSTVFLGLDHRYSFSRNPPLVFETMVFDDYSDDIYMRRCSTWEEAEEMHEKAVEWVKNGCKYEDEE
jgi:hypothetical protein